jgi:hypothetical protein
MPCLTLYIWPHLSKMEIYFHDIKSLYRLWHVVRGVKNLCDAKCMQNIRDICKVRKTQHQHPYLVIKGVRFLKKTMEKSTLTFNEY